MNKVTKSHYILKESLIEEGFQTINYCDRYQVCIHSTDSVDEMTTSIFKVPDWVISLMKLRDFIVRPFGLKTGVKESKADYYPAGSTAVMFPVINRNNNEIVMEADDKHLNFRTSVFVTRKEEECNVYLTTIVHFNNIWGQLYFTIIKPFHQIIMKVCMKRLIKSYEDKQFNKFG